jgi:hypothetical protein
MLQSCPSGGILQHTSAQHTAYVSTRQHSIRQYPSSRTLPPCPRGAALPDTSSAFCVSFCNFVPEKRQFLYFCTSKASNLEYLACFLYTQTHLRQFLYFGTSKALVPVKQVILSTLRASCTLRPSTSAIQYILYILYTIYYMLYTIYYILYIVYIVYIYIVPCVLPVHSDSGYSSSSTYISMYTYIHI